MARRWIAFDPEVMNREFASLPATDRANLFEAMKAYRMEISGGFVLSNYGDGLQMIKSGNRSQGRCLFFTMIELEGTQVLVALAAYKKESQKADKQRVATARDRMDRYRKGH